LVVPIQDKSLVCLAHCFMCMVRYMPFNLKHITFRLHVYAFMFIKL
jgi:hypothetical protein